MMIIDRLKKGVLREWEYIKLDTLTGSGRFERFKLVEDTKENKLTIETLEGYVGEGKLVVFEDVPSEILISELNHLFSGSSSYLYSLIGLRRDIWEAIDRRLGSFAFRPSNDGEYTYQLRLGTTGSIHDILKKSEICWKFDLTTEVVRGDVFCGGGMIETELLIKITTESESTSETYQKIVKIIKEIRTSITLNMAESVQGSERIFEVSYRTRDLLAKDQFREFFLI